MSKFIDLTGRKFGRLIVTKRVYKPKSGRAYWECLCDCGITIIVCGKDLRNGHTQSCGCLRKEVVSEHHKTHGQSNTKLFVVWQSMNKRCNDKNNKNYCVRNIKVCDEWREFIPFYEWAMANGYKDGLTIDRIDNDKGYSPDNCRWVDMKVQSNNRRNNHLITYSGKTQTLQQWADEYNIKRSTLNSRINKLHWTIEKALTTK